MSLEIMVETVLHLVRAADAAVVAAAVAASKKPSDAARFEP
jgi:hypothetical protein